jgi:hypothetical protein
MYETEDEKPLNIFAEKERFFYKDRYIERILTDDTPEGYLELVILSIMGDQFYGNWHAYNNHQEIVCHSSRVKDFIPRHGVPQNATNQVDLMDCPPPPHGGI